MRFLHVTLAAVLAAACITPPVDAKAKRPKRAPASQPAAPATTDATRADRRYANSTEAMRFADEMAERRGLDPYWVRAAISRARFVPTAQRLMRPAPVGTAKNWRVYRSRFIDATRIAAGVRFWRANAETLAQAQDEFGVPPEIVVGIIGVETIYGRNMGSFRVLDALSTLAFNFPQTHPRAAERQAYFREELEAFLWRANQSGDDPFTVLGSYAGAKGMPQFMPSSINKYAIDFDGDGHIDLDRSSADVIGSVASYFKGFGWQAGMPATYPALFDPRKLDLPALLAPDILPTFGAALLQDKGLVLDAAAAQHTGPMALVELQNGNDAPQYVIGTKNFYVVTRYNHSSYYAMAVLELGQAVKDALVR